MDFDSDGRLDLITGSNCCDGNGFHLFRRQNDGSWAPRQRLTVESPKDRVVFLGFGSTFPTAADWNGDGVPDLFLVSGDISVAFGPFNEKEPIVLTHSIRVSPEGSHDVLQVAVADWDDAGKPGLIVHQKRENGEPGIYWYKNIGSTRDPELAEGQLLVKTKTPYDEHVRGFCVCDWTGDGRLDLVVTQDKLLPGTPEHKGGRWQGAVWLYPRE